MNPEKAICTLSVALWPFEAITAGADDTEEDTSTIDLGLRTLKPTALINAVYRRKQGLA